MPMEISGVVTLAQFSDPDGNDGFGGQIQCWGWADNPFDYSTYLFVDTPAGPGVGSAVESDSWGRIKSTFN